MKEIDFFAMELFEEAKRFLERAKGAETDEGRNAFLHAALLLGISALEAHVNAISDEMSERPGLSILDLSVLSEKEYVFRNGRFKLTKALKIYTLTERIEFLVNRFAVGGRRLETHAAWWSKVNQGIDLRNSLTHPKDRHVVSQDQVESAFDGVLGVLDAMYIALYDNHFPALGRHLDSTMHF